MAGALLEPRTGMYIRYVTSYIPPCYHLRGTTRALSSPRRAMKMGGRHSEAGNPIRRPPRRNDDVSDGGGGSGGDYSSSFSLSMRGGVDDDEDYRDGSRPPHPPLHPPPAALLTSRRAEMAHLFLGFALFWPLLFLLVPPRDGSSSRMALLSATGGMDVVDRDSLYHHLDNNRGGSSNGGRNIATARDRIDELRRVVSRKVISEGKFLKDGMRSLLVRTDAVGYGPSRPRFAVIIVVPSPPPLSQHAAADEDGGGKRLLDSTALAVESIFRTSDRNRVFVVAVVMDGRDDGTEGEFEARLRDVDTGRTAHRHGNRVHVHGGREGGTTDADEEHTHSGKVHVIYNRRSLGVSASRDAGARFVNALVREHESAGLKSTEEEMILLLLRCDSTLGGGEFLDGGKKEANDGGVVVVDGVRTWLDDVTDALISTTTKGADAPPGGGDVARPTSPANAVSFVVDHSSVDAATGNVAIRPSNLGSTFSFDRTLKLSQSHASGQDMSLSNGESYPAPLSTAATAMRLNTYNALPACDAMLTTHHAADLQLSLNLWMCADGIDVLGGGMARVVVDPSVLSEGEKSALSGPLAARLVGAWMSGHADEVYADGILEAVASSAASSWWQEGGMSARRPNNDRALLDKKREMKDSLVRIASEAKQTASFPSGLEMKCRPFSWYVQYVNPELEIREDDGSSDPHAALERLPGATGGGKKDEKISPSRPLDDARMGIVLRASPVKLAYVDASGGHLAHPHLGATDENGAFGYVHDETALRNNPPPFEFENDDERERLCKKGDPNYTMLTQKVFVDITNHEAAERRSEHDLAKKRRVKLFCFVYTIEKNHDKIRAIRETWGQKCDGFMVASTKTDKDLGTVNIPHEGPEEYNNIWQKVRAMWSFIYDNYYEKYDYFHIGGDDLYLIVENLRLYLESEEIQLASNGGTYLPSGKEDTQTPLFLGRRFAEGGDRDRMFISGGSGYTLNRAALKALVVDAFPQCFPHMHTFSEDVMVATCLRKMDILPYDTKDEAGGERYMPFEPGHHLTYTPPKNPKDDWYSNYSVDVKWGIDHCAAKSVAFHYISPILMRRMHAILYHRCGAPPTSPHEAAALKAQEKADRIAAEQKVRDHAAAVEQQGNDALQKQDEKKSEKKSVVLARNELDNNPESGLGGSEKAPHLYPHFPPMPPHIMAEDLFGEEIITNTLSYDKPTIAGVVAILQRFLRKLHQMLVENRDALTPDEVIAKYFFLVKEYLAPLDAAYRDRPMFPIREDGSIFMSLGAYRDHLLGETLRQAYKTAAHPDKLFVGAVVQNCFGIGVQCRTGVAVKGTDRLGNPITEISDRPPDVNGIEEFCADPDYAKYCDNGQIRVLYVNETESNGPTTARYFASKLWGGETYYMQSDAHLRFAQDWDRLYHEEVLGAKSYPKAILTSYPPGFSDGDPPYKGGSKGTRLCSCEFSTNPVEHSIIRINTGNNCNGEEEAPTQIAFIAAGFFFTRAEFLTEVPFDPYLPWCFMGEEIALSLRAWTHGWGIYAPRKNLIAHQYRPGRMGLPKFWENTGRVFGRPGPGFNTELGTVTLQRIKHMVGYKESDTQSLEKGGYNIVLTDFQHYGPGDTRTVQEFLDHNRIDMKTEQCGWIDYCNDCTLP